MDRSKVKGMFDDSLNFRELGGYPAANGKQVKHGVFYRSGMLGSLNEDELNQLERLGIKTIIDFRSSFEAEAVPDPVPSGTAYFHVCALYGDDGSEMNFSPKDIEKMLQGQNSLQSRSEMMMNLMYGNMAFNNRGFKKLFQEIELGHVPILFHCTAGKDRTGVAAMLLLLALGADEETALADYELTNVYRHKEIQHLIDEHAAEIEDNPEMISVFRRMAGVNPSAGVFVFERIKERYGDFGRYFEAEYGLTAENLKVLQERYLE